MSNPAERTRGKRDATPPLRWICRDFLRAAKPAKRPSVEVAECRPCWRGDRAQTRMTPWTGAWTHASALTAGDPCRGRRGRRGGRRGRPRPSRAGRRHPRRRRRRGRPARRQDGAVARLRRRRRSHEPLAARPRRRGARRLAVHPVRRHAPGQSARLHRCGPPGRSAKPSTTRTSTPCARRGCRSRPACSARTCRSTWSTTGP